MTATTTTTITMKRSARLLRLVLLCTAALLAWGGPAPAGAGPAADPLPPLLPGEIVTLLGTRPELWVADDQSVLHFVGDTRAVDDHRVDWTYRLQVSIDQLRALPLGDPWLSTSLVRDGERIYLPRWESSANAPTLQHIQASGDLSLLGIVDQNYATFVLPAPEWEQRFGFRVRDLAQQPLPPLTAPPAPANTPSPATTPATTPVSPPSPATALARVPTYGPAGSTSDVAFTILNWTDAASSLPALTRLMPTGTLQGERPLGLWRLGQSGQPYVYVQAIAIELAPHPEVKSVAHLAALKLRFLRNDSDSLDGGTLQATTIAGQPAVRTESRATRRFSTGPGARGIVSSSDMNQYVTQLTPDSAVTELIWSARDVFVIRGNWGYNFRYFSTGPAMLSAHQAEFDTMLAGVTFNY